MTHAELKYAVEGTELWLLKVHCFTTRRVQSHKSLVMLGLHTNLSRSVDNSIDQVTTNHLTLSVTH